MRWAAAACHKLQWAWPGSDCTAQLARQLASLRFLCPMPASPTPHPSPGRAAGLLLACKRLSHLFCSEPSVWRTFRLDTDAASEAAQASWRTWGPNARSDSEAAAAKCRWLATRLRLLQRQASMVERLEVHDKGGHFLEELYGAAEGPQPGGSSAPAAAAVSLPAFFSSLQPGRVQAVELFIREVPDAAMAQLLRLAPQLAHLSIDTNVDREWGGELPPSTCAVLPRLPQLLSLEIACPADVTNALVEAVGRVTWLTHLNLWCGVDAALPALPQLTRLQRLSKLELTINWHRYEAEGWEEAEVPELPLPTLFPALRTYTVRGSGWGGPQVG